MKKLLALVLAVVLIMTLVSCGAKPETPETPTPEAPVEPVAQDIVEKIKANGKLVIGTEAQYAPFEFKDADTNFAGCDIWLAEQIATELGVTLEVVDMAFDGIIPAVKSGQVDIGLAAFTVTPERAEEIDFTEVYQRDEQMLIVQKGNEAKYTTKESLSGLKVGAQKGTVQSILIKSALPDSELFELAKYPALAMEVANGNIAGLVVDGAVGEGLVGANDKIIVSEFKFDPAEANFGKAAVINKGNESLKEIANTVIKKVMEDGSFQKAYDAAVELSKTLGI